MPEFLLDQTHLYFALYKNKDLLDSQTLFSCHGLFSIKEFYSSDDVLNHADPRVSCVLAHSKSQILKS